MCVGINCRIWSVCDCFSCRGLCVWAPLRAFLMRDLRQALEQNRSADQKHRLGLADLHNAASAERPQFSSTQKLAEDYTQSSGTQTERRGHFRAWTHSHHPWPHLKQQPLLINSCFIYLFSHILILLIDLFSYYSHFYIFFYVAIYFRHICIYLDNFFLSYLYI